MRRSILTAGLLTAGAMLAAPNVGHAFCGFYISGAGADMFNNATQVVLMREGTRTVLSMQNNYQGPPENFAMVVPVPVVLQEENVKTLDKAVLGRVDQLAAPRLVEYWEQDPCNIVEYDRMVAFSAAPAGAVMKQDAPADELGVTIEAQFTVGEYEIVILSAKDSAGLDTWLRQEKYQIPTGAEPLLRPYVQAGSKFFVAKVNTEKVTFKDGMAMLSPLRFHYDSDEFSLPIRLGMINARDKQDLIVHILARGKRYEVANYKNVTIPTNLDVTNETRDRFGEFYAALFDATVEKNPGAVITEYSWDASTCDPCPSPALTPSELATLGADVLDPAATDKTAPARWQGGFVLTRLHARYSKGDIGEDLVFKEAAAIAGGREVPGDGGKLEQGTRPSGYNNFQGRYAIRHEWTGPIECENPQRGHWGGPPGNSTPPPKPALDLAFAPRGKAKIGSFVKQNIPEIGVVAAGVTATPQTEPAAGEPAKNQPAKTDKRSKKGCGCRVSPAPAAHAGVVLLAVIAILGLVWLRRRDR